MIGFSEIIAAGVGATASGLFGIFDRRAERRRSSKALKAEISAHASFLTNLIREQKYLGDAIEVAEASKHPAWDGALLFIMPKADYLHGLLAAVRRAGELEPDEARTLIEYHHRAQLFLDSTNPDERFLEDCSFDERRSHAIETAENAKRLVQLGDQLAQLK